MRPPTCHYSWSSARQLGLLVFLCLLTRGTAASKQWTCPGGGDAAGSTEHAAALSRFLADQLNTCATTTTTSSSSRTSPNKPTSDGRFYIQGWRWHTMSLIREAKKLQQVAETMLGIHSNSAATDADLTPAGPAAAKALHQASEYIVNFNMKGLHHIEKDLFFPWATKKVADAVKETDVALAFRSIMDQLERDRKALVDLGASLLEDTARIAAHSSKTSLMSELERVAVTSAAIAGCAHAMLTMEDSYLVPTIAALVPAKEQKSFNDKVIRNLGILDSRLYLVGMYEALQDLKDQKELDLFDESIPSLARKMIPRWRRKLYDPKVGDALKPKQ